MLREIDFKSFKQDGNGSLAKMKKKALYEEVVDYIQQLITSGELRKGDMLPSENEMAKQAKVSRVTIRESLRLLAEMGLIETKRGVGSFVAVDAGQNDIRNSFHSFLGEFDFNFEQAIQTKAILDPQIARHVAARISGEDIQVLESLLAQTAENKNNNKKYAELCRKLHIAIVDTLRLAPLSQLYRQLEDLENTSTRLILLAKDTKKELVNIDINQHQKIIAAFKNHDEDFAYFYTLEHIKFFQAYYTDMNG